MQQSSFSINSKHFITRIDNDIIQLIKTLIVEHQISIDEAKIMARRIIQNKINLMLTEDETKGIENLSETTTRMIKDQTGGFPIRNYISKVYELLKIMGFK